GGVWRLRVGFAEHRQGNAAGDEGEGPGRDAPAPPPLGFAPGV
ncbi:MAG: hypothetical protein AVDCRST_MAG25-2432, partial [uncultured Rubrobacteraceae bacterium]